MGVIHPLPSVCVYICVYVEREDNGGSIGWKKKQLRSTIDVCVDYLDRDLGFIT